MTRKFFKKWAGRVFLALLVLMVIGAFYRAFTGSDLPGFGYLFNTFLVISLVYSLFVNDRRT